MKLRKNKKDEDIYDIEATIYCLRESHKGIIIGKNGEMLKRIGKNGKNRYGRKFWNKSKFKNMGKSKRRLVR